MEGKRDQKNDREEEICNETKNDFKNKIQAGEFSTDIIKAEDRKKNAEAQRRDANNRLWSATIDKYVSITVIVILMILLSLFAIFKLSVYIVIVYVILFFIGIFYRRSKHRIKEEEINIEVTTDLVKKVKRQLLKSGKDL